MEELLLSLKKFLSCINPPQIPTQYQLIKLLLYSLWHQASTHKHPKLHVDRERLLGHIRRRQKQPMRVSNRTFDMQDAGFVGLANCTSPTNSLGRSFANECPCPMSFGTTFSGTHS